MEIVMVEFAVGPETVAECVLTINELLASVIAKQAHFHGARIHIEESKGTVINIMRWDKAADFIAFQESNQDVITPVLGKFESKARMLEIAVEVAARH